MKPFSVKNSSNSPIKLTIQKDGVPDSSLILHSKDILDIPKLSGAKVTFDSPVDITFRVTKPFGCFVRQVKETRKNVSQLELPPIFSILKVKKIKDE